MHSNAFKIFSVVLIVFNGKKFFSEKCIHFVNVSAFSKNCSMYKSAKHADKEELQIFVKHT